MNHTRSVLDNVGAIHVTFLMMYIYTVSATSLETNFFCCVYISTYLLSYYVLLETAIVKTCRSRQQNSTSLLLFVVFVSG